MKQIGYLTLCWFLLSGSSCEANISHIQQTLDQLKMALNQHHFETISPHLAPDFSFDGYTGNMGQVIMRQVVAQYPVVIDSITIEKVEKLGGQFAVSTLFHSENGHSPKEIVLSYGFKIIQAPIVKIQMGNHKSPKMVSPSLDDRFPAQMVMPFELAGRLIMVQAEIEGVRGNFIVDSGALGFYLNKRALPQLQQRAQPMTHTVHGAGGAIQDVKRVQASNFRWQKVQLDTVNALYQDLSHLEENTGIQIVGLIGADFLRRFTVQFDYARQELTLFSVNPDAYWKIAPNAAIPFRMIGHIPVIDAQIGDYTLRFGLDSGAEGAQIMAKWEEVLLPHAKFLQYDQLNGADTHSRRVKKVRLDEFLIGDGVYQNHTFVFADIYFGHESSIDGLLGFEFLSTQKTAIDFQNQKLYFWRASEF